MKHVIEPQYINDFCAVLEEEERTEGTIYNYSRCVETFTEWVGSGKEFDKATVISFKATLKEKYKLSTANNYINALNKFFKIMGWNECCVSSYKLQQKTFRDTGRELTHEEYRRLLEAAKGLQNDQLFYIIQTLAGTGMRVSELQYITVEAVSKKRVSIHLKGKYREILLPTELCKLLETYCELRKIESGVVFRSKRGNLLDRNNIGHWMKKLSEKADVPREKIFPHNLRHFFAVNYYSKDHDLVHLADLLGHSNINTTRIYTQISADKQMSILDKMESEIIYHI